jgi:hypothetical protein
MKHTGRQAINRAGKGQSSPHALVRLAVSSALCATGQLISAAPAYAATGNVTFTSNVSVNNSCAIVVVNNGRFGVAVNVRQLSSKLSGGMAAVANIVSTTNYRISAIPNPALTSYPTGGNTGVAMAALYSGQSISNGRTFSERNGTSRVRLRNGLSTTRVTVHLAATRAGSAFPSGYYQGAVTLRCE